jgi:hypothetical protein
MTLMPVGHRAWTGAGLAGIAAHARPLADCGPEQLWRGRLHLTVIGHVSVWPERRIFLRY